MKQRTSDLDFIRSPTPQLRAMIEQYRSSRGTAQFQALLSTIRRKFEAYSETLSACSPGAERAETAHRLLNEAFAQSSGIESTCGKGCAACCHLEVEITNDEAELLARRVNEGTAIDRERLATQAARARRSADWNPAVQAANRCVFLGDDDACRAYESRPSICRKHVVSSPPGECSLDGGHPTSIPIPLAEIVVSAALSQPGNGFQSLSKALGQALGLTNDQRDAVTSPEATKRPNTVEIVRLIASENLTKRRAPRSDETAEQWPRPVSASEPQGRSVSAPRLRSNRVADR